MASFVLSLLNYFIEHPEFLVAIFLFCIFFYFLSQFLTTPKPGRNPFANDCTKPPKPLIIDPAARDQILKQGFQAKKVPDNLDAVVIGSGMGGLAAAAILAKAGKKVLVLEQHDQAGGCCHTFVEEGFEFDVGIHYIGEMRNNTTSRVMMEQLTEGQLCWEDLDDEFDICAIGEPGSQKFYPFHAGSREAYKAALLKKFPEEEDALDKYLALLKETRTSMLGLMQVKFMPKRIVRLLVATGLINWMTNYFKLSKRTLQEVLDELTDNPDLKTVLSYSFGDYGTIPKKGSFAMHAALVNHYLFGASYPRGGASELVIHMIPIIEKAGGRVLVRAPVTQILTENGRAVGVRVHKGDDIDIKARLVISDAGVMNTFTRLLPPTVAEKSGITSMLHKKVEYGVACMSLFVGLKGSTEELGLKGHNIWAYTSNDINASAEEYMALSPEDAAKTDIPLLFISFPSAKDPTYHDRYPGRSTAIVISFAKWEWFSKWDNERVKKRGEDYDSIKNAIGKRMWEQALAVYPKLADKVEYFEVATPISNKFYIGSPRGEIYGLDHTTKRFGSPSVMMNLRAETDIPGLVLTGQDVLNCGMIGAAYGGLLCASQVLNRNLYGDLLKLKKKMMKQK